MNKRSPLISIPSSDRSLGFSEDLLREIQQEKEEVQRIRRERLRVHELKEEFAKKEGEMQRLQSENKELYKYRGYMQKYNKMKEMLDDAMSKYDAKEKQNEKLLYELDRAMLEIQNLQKRSGECDKSRSQLIKQRSHLERLNKEIEQTFHEYKRECKVKEKQLVDKLEKAYRQIKEDRRTIEQLDAQATQSHLHQKRMIELEQSLKEKDDHATHLMEMLRIKEHELAAVRHDINKKIEEEQRTVSTKMDEAERSQLILENQQLRKELYEKDKELQKSKALNHQLSIEFDRSVTRIGEFERELSEYRRQNHELKKTLTLFIEKDEYDKMHRQMQKSDDAQDSFCEFKGLSSRAQATYQD